MSTLGLSNDVPLCLSCASLFLLAHNTAVELGFALDQQVYKNHQQVSESIFSGILYIFSLLSLTFWSM